MIVVYCFTEAWAKYIPTQLYALQANNPSVEKVYLISDNIPRDVMEEIDPYDCEWIKPPNVFNELNTCGRFTVASLWRLLIPQLVPASQCIYLDADTLVVGDIEILMRLENETVTGAIDIQIGKRHLKQIGFRGKNYINAGVLLMNLDAIRSSGLGKKWIELANAAAYSVVDQDIINLTTSPRLITSEYNSCASTGVHESPKIIHFAGPKSKNWVEGIAQSELWDQWNAKYLATINEKTQAV